ncbi:hypothetical protein QF002_001330 [Paraburkholderia youngii]
MSQILASAKGEGPLNNLAKTRTFTFCFFLWMVYDPSQH